MKSYFRTILGIAGMSLAGVLAAGASTVTYNFGELSSGTAPAGSPPWVQAIFTDTGLPANTVQLTVSAGNLTGSEFVSCWYFNLNPALDPTALSFSVSSSTGSFTDPSVQTGANAFKAGPDGKYDVLLGFSIANSGRFMGGDSVTFTITDASGLTADDFDQLGTAGSSGSFASAAHIQSIGDNGDSAWINPTETLLTPNGNFDGPSPVPDTSTTAGLLGISFVAVEILRRKIQARSAAQ